MSPPDGARLCRAVAATWPAADSTRLGPWTIREGRGGGQRASAATADDPFAPEDIARAERAMRDLGQEPLFWIRDGDTALDNALEDAGYRVHDPVALYAIETARLTDTPLPRVAAFTIWPPLALMNDLWDEAGIGPARRAVMARVAGPKAGILARQNDRPAGVAFVACDDTVAMIHAIDVVPAQRRQGVGVNILRKAAFWAEEQQADTLALAVTRANGPANALYASIGMEIVGYYHYRLRK